ncbi:MAG: tellurite methyltransferase, partial [Marivirga sp.]
MHWKAINKIIGNIDIYWLDFILKGHLADDAKVLDIG